MSGIHHIEIYRLEEDARLRVELTVGSFPDAAAATFGEEPEGIQISVLIPAPPLAESALLKIELLALRRAQEVLERQVQSTIRTLERRGA